MPKLQIIPIALATVVVGGCTQHHAQVGPLPIPMSQTASADWSIPIDPADRYAQVDEDADPTTLEERARAIFGTTPLRGNLPDNSLSQELLFKFLVSEIAAQRGNLQLAAQGYLEMAKATRDPRLAKRATEMAAYGRLQNLALDAARLWAELDKDNVQARQAVASLLVSSDKLSEAKPYLQALLTADGNVANGFMQLHQLLSKHPDHNAVLERHQRIGEGLSAVARSAFRGCARRRSRPTSRIWPARRSKKRSSSNPIGSSARCSTRNCCSSANRRPRRWNICRDSCKPIRSRRKCAATTPAC